MLFNPRNAPRNLHVTSARRALRSALALCILGAGFAAAQDFGGHTLPPDLADPAAKVIGVLNKDPKNASRAMGYSEGPAVDSAGNLYFTEDIGSNGNIWKVTPQGVGSNFYTGPALPNGMEFDPQGRLTACEQGSISTYDKNGARTPLTMLGNPDLKRVNDVTIAVDGGMWFTNHQFGNTFFYRAPNGTVTSYPNVAPLGVAVPNGIEFIEEKNLLLVNSSNDNKVYQYDVSPDRKPSNKRFFATVAVPDGITVDEKGNIYVASWGDGKIQVFNSTGKALGDITVKSAGTDADGQNGNTSNCVFGGSENKTLYITGDGGAYKIVLKVAGRKRPGTTNLRNRMGFATPSPHSAEAGYSIDGRKFSGEKLNFSLLLSTLGIP